MSAPDGGDDIKAGLDREWPARGLKIERSPAGVDLRLCGIGAREKRIGSFGAERSNIDVPIPALTGFGVDRSPGSSRSTG